MLSDDRALLQRNLCALIRAAIPAERTYRASRAKAIAVSGGTLSITDELMWATIAAVASDGELFDAVANVRQALVLEHRDGTEVLP